MSLLSGRWRMTSGCLYASRRTAFTVNDSYIGAYKCRTFSQRTTDKLWLTKWFYLHGFLPEARSFRKYMDTVLYGLR